MLFLSAPHLAGDDVRQRSEERRRYRFYPRHPRGWRRIEAKDAKIAEQFLSTPPSRVATAGKADGQEAGEVSIHATLAGGDSPTSYGGTGVEMFLSTPPSRVATLSGWFGSRHTHSFLSTPPSRVATLRRFSAAPGRHVSIHATLAGGDVQLARATM